MQFGNCLKQPNCIHQMTCQIFTTVSDHPTSKAELLKKSCPAMVSLRKSTAGPDLEPVERRWGRGSGSPWDAAFSADFKAPRLLTLGGFRYLHDPPCQKMLVKVSPNILKELQVGSIYRSTESDLKIRRNMLNLSEAGGRKLEKRGYETYKKIQYIYINV